MLVSIVFQYQIMLYYSEWMDTLSGEKNADFEASSIAPDNRVLGNAESGVFLRLFLLLYA